MTSKPLAPASARRGRRGRVAAGRWPRRPRSRSGTRRRPRASPRGRAACAGARAPAARRRRRGRALCRSSCHLKGGFARPRRADAERESACAPRARCCRPRTRGGARRRRGTRAGRGCSTARRRCATARARCALNPTPLSLTSIQSVVVAALRRDLHEAGARLRRDAVLDGVLDERLQDQARHLGVERLRVDVEVHRRRS